MCIHLTLMRMVVYTFGDLRSFAIIVLHRKGGARDPRNYRPITLFQSD